MRKILVCGNQYDSAKPPVKAWASCTSQARLSAGCTAASRARQPSLGTAGT